MLHVPLLELARGGPQQVLARDFAPGGGQGHHVLELVAETVGAGGLVEGGAPPDPAGEGLVEKPAVQEDVHGPVGRLDPHGRERVVPHSPHGGEAGAEVLAPVASDDAPRVGLVLALAEQEDHAHLLAGSQAQRGLQRGARVESRARLAREPSLARERGRSVEGPVAAEELGAVGRPRGRARAQIREGDAPGELLVPGVRAKSAPVSASRCVMMWGAEAPRWPPSTHSA